MKTPRPNAVRPAGQMKRNRAVRLPIQIASWIICLVWSMTNLTLAFSQWQNLGHPTESPAGTYEFTDPLAG